MPRRAERSVGVVLVEQVAVARHQLAAEVEEAPRHLAVAGEVEGVRDERPVPGPQIGVRVPDRKSTRLNSSHLGISYAVFCLKKKKKGKKNTSDNSAT